MFTSIGYHTLSISMGLIKQEASMLLEDFKKYRDRTNEIYFDSSKKTYSVDPGGRHYEIKYLESKGIIWRIRFGNKGYLIHDKYISCSIKAIINPKILVGEKSYIIAADASYLDKIEEIFNKEAEKISPLLRKFDDYSLNRLDYCINCDISELKVYPVQSTSKMPKMLMELIRCGDIPEKFEEEYRNIFEFYLKSNAVVINCYWKYYDLTMNFEECDDLEKSKDIIRFEVQYKYPKVNALINKIKKDFVKFRGEMFSQLRLQAIYDTDHNLEGVDKLKFKQSVELLKGNVTENSIKKLSMMSMMSDEKCIEVIKKYFNKTIKSGAYYTFDVAKRKIEANVSGWEKIIRLTDALRLIRDSGGIAKAKKNLQDKELDKFRGSLRDLANLGINPVTIPEEWGITYIPSLLDAYYNKLNNGKEEGN